MQTHPPDFRAQVRFLTYKEGGRRSPVFQGYRPDVAYKEGAFELFMIWPRFLDDALKEREEESEVPNQSLADFHIVDRKLKEEVHRRRIKPGTELWLFGSARVARKSPR